MSVLGVILVCIFPHSDWILRDTPYLSVSLSIHSECGKLRTRITPNTDTFQVLNITDFFYFFGNIIDKSVVSEVSLKSVCFYRRLLTTAQALVKLIPFLLFVKLYCSDSFQKMSPFFSFVIIMRKLSVTEQFLFFC